MFDDLKNIVRRYKEIVLPAIEQGKIPFDTEIINSFLQFVHALYERTIYESEADEKELNDRIQNYIKTGNGQAILGAMYSFLYAAPSIMELQSKTTMLQMYHDHCKMAHIANVKKNIEWEKCHDFDKRSHFEGKGVVYSAITGGYDKVKEPEFVDPALDYILFTDNPNIKSDVWKVVVIDNDENLDKVRLARKMKITGYKYLQDYDYSVWIDGKIAIKGNIKEYILQQRGKHSILCFPHYLNSCIYEELDSCVQLGKDDQDTMIRQIENYRKDGYPEYNGMIDSCILVRELKDERLNRVMDTWWYEVRNGSRRDQLSFNYAFWKNDYVYDTSELCCYDNQYFSSKEHGN